MVVGRAIFFFTSPFRPGSLGGLSNDGRNEIDGGGGKTKDRILGCKVFSKLAAQAQSQAHTQVQWSKSHRSGFEDSAFPNYNREPVEERNNSWTPEIAPLSGSGRDKFEQLWRDLLADPSKWWDNRPGKCSPKSPDFKHKESGEALWLNDKRTPAWALSEVIALFGSEREKVDVIWRAYFADPSKWWDNRSRKESTNFPDFKHKQTGQSLSLDNKCTPAWVKSKLASRQSSDTEKSWRDLFSNPSKWWDHRSRRKNPRSPDFIHKLSTEALWLHGRQTPTWVASTVACLGPGTLQTDIISKVEILSRYNKFGHFSKTLELFEQMQQEGIVPDCYIFLHVLHACAAEGVLKEGRRIHAQILETGWESHPYISSSLVDMYAKCGSLEDGWNVLNKRPTRNVVSWNALILGYVNCGQGVQALKLYEHMLQVGVVPDSRTFVALLNACASMAALAAGRRVHKQVFRSGCESDAHVASSLIDMYAKCGRIEDARAVFYKMPKRCVVSWTALMNGFVKCGQGLEALQLFQHMQLDDVVPNPSTFVALLNACGMMAALEEGRRVHNLVIQSGCEGNAYVGSALVDMYCKCGSVDDARRVFDELPARDVVAWNAMILGYVKCGQGYKSIELFQYMQRDGIVPDSVTFVALLNACASMAALEEGRVVHNQVVWSGCESDTYVASSLIYMYTKCGSMEDAQAVFDKMPIRNVVAWNAMIQGLVKCGRGVEASVLFKDMQQDGIEPNSITFVALLNACASMASLEKGREIHNRIVQSGFESNIHVASSLVDMYAKCGSLREAQHVFDKMPTRDVVAWTAMILGFAMHGFGKEAVALFEQMSRSGCEIHEVTFSCLLSACSHGGLLKEGLQYLEQMEAVYGVPPTQEHYSCIVDMLGRVDRHDAKATVNKMPFKPSAELWMALLSACRTHGSLEIGERAAQQLMKLDLRTAAGYLASADFDATAGYLNRQKYSQGHKPEKKEKKLPGRAWIEVQNEVHCFALHDRRHPQMKQILAELDKLSKQILTAGYVPATKVALQKNSEEDKVKHLFGHTEKLALAFGLISTPAASPLRIATNRRVCGDCHAAIKCIAKIVGREITLRDAKRFHLFKDGHCSCGDF